MSKARRMRRNDLAHVVGVRKTDDLAGRLWTRVSNMLIRAEKDRKAQIVLELAERAKHARALRILSSLAPFVDKPGSGITKQVFAEMLTAAGFDPVTFFATQRIVREADSEVDKKLREALEKIGLTPDDIKKFRRKRS